MRRIILLCLLLAGITLACFWPVGRLDFVNYDDSKYVFQNPFVLSGLNYQSIVWAFTTFEASNWHPVTWLSHMLDCQLFGSNAHEQHWVNLAFHTANALLLFLLLRWLTSACWRSFLAAALFACHPMHVESVAWIAERKDVLSGFFALLTLLAYVHYCRNKTLGRFAGVFLLLALGLMSKPMLVTLPGVMLLLDFWPLARVQLGNPDPNSQKLEPYHWLISWRQAFIEKIPLFLLSFASCLVTIWSQSSGGSVVSLGHIPWDIRLLHAVSAYSLYLWKLFWPANLAVFYPFTFVDQETLLRLSPLPLILSAISLWQARRHPYFLMGWGWFVITLIPVIGLVQVGMQAIADRYAYLPSIGIFIALAWGMAELAARSQTWRAGMAALGTLLVLACGLQTRHQLGYWRDTVTLFQHAVGLSPEKNFWGHFLLGNANWSAGRLSDAANSYSAALEVAPESRITRACLGKVLVLEHNFKEGEFQFSEILRAHPETVFDVSEHMFFGMALAGQHKIAEAQVEYQAASQLAPDDASIQNILEGNTRLLETEQTLETLTGQMKTNATPEIMVQIAAAQTTLGNYQAAVDYCQQAIRLNPEFVAGLNNLAWLLATCPDATVRDGKRAVVLAEKTCQLTQFKTTVFLGTLAAAYAEAGRFDDAIAAAQKACANASARGETGLLRRNQQLLALYQQHQPCHEDAEKPVPAAP